MRAVVMDAYGPPDLLGVEDIAVPVPGPGQVLVRVAAVGLNPADWHFVRGTPYVARLAFGLRRPRPRMRGTDMAGIVEVPGPGVRRLRPGDEVYGWAEGAPFAELVCVSEATVAPKPANLTFEEAAAVPLSGVTALQGLRGAGRLRAGQAVLINGASGGVGTFAVQIAKALGAEVTGVCSTRNLDLVRFLGADHVIDYTKQDVTRLERRYDLVLDNVGGHSISAWRGVLTPTGTLLPNSGDGGRWIGPMATVVEAFIVSLFVRQRLRPFFTNMTCADLVELKDLIDAGQLQPVIDTIFPLDRTGDALGYLEAGHARGKVVVTM
jgi:NADPH:quinone reductase-like Zn-dependent oxidoreductase